MAFGAQKIFPIDTKPGVAVGVSLNFNNPGVFQSTYLTKDAVKNNLINYFLTNQPERYLNPNFGGNLRKYLFEQINSNTTDFLKEDIQQQINLYFPNVIVASLDVVEYTDTNQIVVTLKYTIADTNISDQLDIAFN
jgi:phage baseplate assembly protein W